MSMLGPNSVGRVPSNGDDKVAALSFRQGEHRPAAHGRALTDQIREILSPRRFGTTMVTRMLAIMPVNTPEEVGGGAPQPQSYRDRRLPGL